jgi:hypothetical protein
MASATHESLMAGIRFKFYVNLDIALEIYFCFDVSVDAHLCECQYKSSRRIVLH